MVQEFIFEYFCRPIIDSSVQGYNLVNTAFFALILFGVVYFWLYPWLKREQTKLDFKFMLALLPYVFLGAALRVLTDIGAFGIYKTCNILDLNFFTFTPGIWFLITGITIIGLLVAKKLSKKEGDFPKYFGGIGLILALPVILYEVSIFKAWDGFAMTIAIVAVLTLATKIVVEWKKKGFFDDKLNILVVAGQALDGSATFVATDIFNCGEQHPLSEAILGVHPALFILVKIILAVLIIHYLEKDVKDKNFRQFIKIAVIILGFATGGRDILTLAVGTCM